MPLLGFDLASVTVAMDSLEQQTCENTEYSEVLSSDEHAHSLIDERQGKDKPGHSNRIKEPVSKHEDGKSEIDHVDLSVDQQENSGSWKHSSLECLVLPNSESCRPAFNVEIQQPVQRVHPNDKLLENDTLDSPRKGTQRSPDRSKGQFKLQLDMERLRSRLEAVRRAQEEQENRDALRRAAGREEDLGTEADEESVIAAAADLSCAAADYDDGFILHPDTCAPIDSLLHPDSLLPFYASGDPAQPATVPPPHAAATRRRTPHTRPQQPPLPPLPELPGIGQGCLLDLRALLLGIIGDDDDQAAAAAAAAAAAKTESASAAAAAEPVRFLQEGRWGRQPTALV
jgi:hypothetical protein